jgi:hypothetical protein
MTVPSRRWAVFAAYLYNPAAPPPPGYTREGLRQALRTLPPLDRQEVADLGRLLVALAEHGGPMHTGELQAALMPPRPEGDQAEWEARWQQYIAARRLGVKRALIRVTGRASGRLRVWDLA